MCIPYISLISPAFQKQVKSKFKLIAAYTRTNTNSSPMGGFFFLLLLILPSSILILYEQHVRTAFDRRHAKTVVINN